MQVKGLYTAIVTPFDKKGHLDENGLRKNIRFQIKNGCDGIVALGTTGEDPTLSPQERERVVEIAVEETKSKCKLMVGTGSYSTQNTIKSTILAQEMGADSVLVVSPYYNKPTQEGLYRHFMAVADATDIPIIVYNIQGRTGLNIHVETLARIAKHPRIVGVKEASGNLLQMGEVIETIALRRPDFSVMSGDDNLTFPLAVIGGHGIISVAANLIPKQIKKLLKMLEQGQYEKARELHYELMPLFRGMFIETNPIPVKTAMNLCGMAAGQCRLPLCEMSPENEKKLKQILKTAKI